MLLARADISDGDFVACFPDADPILLAHTRHAVSQFFDVPAHKIHPGDNLRSDLHVDALEPSFHFFVVSHVLHVRHVALQSFTFSMGDVNHIGDLANAIQHVLDGFCTRRELP